MHAEIVMIGTELLLGQIVDTNASYIGQILAENGINLYQKATVGDNPQRIRHVLEDALSRADVVLTSGGLGPTEDDITRECVAELTGRPLEFRQELYEQLAERFARFRRPITENNRKQAYAPRGAIAIPNPNGTAPGLIVEDKRGVIICMPGVPHELHAMLSDSVLPYMRQKWGIEGVLHYRVLHVCGVGESRVDALIGDLIVESDNPKIGLLAYPDSVRIRLSARARTMEEANTMIDALEARVRSRLPGLIMGTGHETIEGVVDRMLEERGWKLAIAETYTGGAAAQRLVAAGAHSFAGSFVQPPTASEALDAAAARLVDETRKRFPAECVLAISSHVEERRAWVLFEWPEGRAEWEIGFVQLDALNQVRGAVVALEHVRRALAGVPDEVADGKS